MKTYKCTNFYSDLQHWSRVSSPSVTFHIHSRPIMVVHVLPVHYVIRVSIVITPIKSRDHEGNRTMVTGHRARAETRDPGVQPGAP